jgi:hypothetical protein
MVESEIYTHAMLGSGECGDVRPYVLTALSEWPDVVQFHRVAVASPWRKPLPHA